MMTDPEQALARFGGRRFTLVFVSSLAYAALLVGAYINESTYLTLQLATVGAFIAGRGHQKHIEVSHNARLDSKIS